MATVTLMREPLKRGIRIDFAHRTFDWSSEARGRAHVHVVIEGFSFGGLAPRKTIYEYSPGDTSPTAIVVKNISPYLSAGGSVVVSRASKPIVASAPPMAYGSIGIDDGLLIVEAEEATRYLKGNPELKPYLRPIVGSRELLYDEIRYCLWLVDAPAAVLSLDVVRERVSAVRNYRLSRDRETTKSLADVPYLFGENRQPRRPYLGLPKVSAQTRRYIPMKFLPETVIASGSCLTVEGADTFHFAILSSEMFMTWVQLVGGRMKSDYQLSATTIYNSFPWPSTSTRTHDSVAQMGLEILDVRGRHADRNLAQMYDPLSMPADLVNAHTGLDHQVRRLYGTVRDLETKLARETLLLNLYATMTGLSIDVPLDLDV